MDFTPFADHLVYLGYTTSTKSEGEIDIMYAEALGKPDFNITKVSKAGFLLIRSNWNILNESDDLDTIINDLNGKSVNVSSVWHYDASDGSKALGISAAYFGDYDKTVFGLFLDSYLADVNRVVLSTGGKKILNPLA